MQRSVEELQINQAKIEHGINPKYVFLKFGTVEIKVFIHGGINTMRQQGVSVTSDRTPGVMLRPMTKMELQRGGNPFHTEYTCLEQEKV